MRLLLLVAALLGAWCQTYTTSATLPQTTVNFNISISGNVANVVVRFVASNTLGWVAMGWSGGTMSNSDIFFCEQTGTLARHWPTTTLVSAATRQGTATGTCASSTVGGQNIKTMTYTRSIANTSNKERPIRFGPSKVIFARGSYPYQNHGQSRTVADINIPAPPGTPTPASTSTNSSVAPTPAPLNGIPGYPMLNQPQRFGGNYRLGWQVVGTSIRFAFDAPDCTWIALGFQNPAASSQMTGDAIIATSDGNMILTKVTYGATPATVATGTYWTNGSVTVAGGLLRGEFTRTAAAPQAGAVALDLSKRVPIMVACGNGYPEQHTERETVLINLSPQPSPGPVVDQPSPAVAPKIVSIVLLVTILAVTIF